MSKIICDVCGTSYPETATQCPICGCVRSGDAVTVTGDVTEETKQPTSTYTPVKGGRFSKANVKKRNSGKPLCNVEPKPAPKPATKPVMRREESGSTNQAPAVKKVKKPKQKPVKQKNSALRRKINEIVLVVVVIILLIAIAGVAIYMACKFLGIDVKKELSNPTTKPTSSNQSTDPTGTDPTTDTKPEVTVPSDQRVPCTSITVKPGTWQPQSAGATTLLDVKVEPANCTDKVTFECEDGDSIVKVNADGLVTAVANGTTSVIVKCGDQQAECLIVCKFEGTEEPTQPVDPPVTTPTYDEEDLTFIDNGYGYSYTFHASNIGEKYTIYNGEIPENLITFTSSNEDIVTVDEFGVINTVGKGVAKVYAQYDEWIIEAQIIID